MMNFMAFSFCAFSVCSIPALVLPVFCAGLGTDSEGILACPKKG